MKHSVKILIAAALTFLSMTLFSCYTPSPLYGTWADNNGNKIQFMQDGTFTAKIQTGISSTGDTYAETYNGTYTVLESTLIFSFESGNSRNTSWDISGSILYITWEEGSKDLSLTLYHTSR